MGDEYLIGKNLKTAREHLNLTQRTFAEGINFHYNYLCLVENGHRSLSDRAITTICQKYNINEHWLRTGEGNMFINNEPKINTPEKSCDKDIEGMLEDKQQDLTVERFRRAVISVVANADTGELKVLQTLVSKVSKY